MENLFVEMFRKFGGTEEFFLGIGGSEGKLDVGYIRGDYFPSCSAETPCLISFPIKAPYLVDTSHDHCFGGLWRLEGKEFGHQIQVDLI
jgi:hypothetical protein